jgi:hypothetical protein
MLSGTPGGGYRDWPLAPAGWMKEESELLGVPLEERDRLTVPTAVGLTCEASR